MSQAYSNPAQAADPYALPDVETFRCNAYTCDACDATTPGFGDYYGVVDLDCPVCGAKDTRCLVIDNDAFQKPWWYWPCFPGCLPDGGPIGPFDTEADALADAREGYEG